MRRFEVWNFTVPLSLILSLEIPLLSSTRLAPRRSMRSAVASISFRAASTLVRQHASTAGSIASYTTFASTTPRRVSSSSQTVAMAASGSPEPIYHVLQYTYVPDILERRDPYRAEHLQGAKDMAAERKIVMAGALTDPVDGAIFVFRNVGRDEIEAFVKKDPYVVNGLVPEYHIRPYMVVADSL